ncbi:MAG: hypothetical protein Q8O67_31465 [Deltaproteobacteria bacterium]|nr:hypothetical protein [Deltaproteobacteria bacterium]
MADRGRLDLERAGDRQPAEDLGQLDRLVAGQAARDGVVWQGGTNARLCQTTLERIVALGLQQVRLHPLSDALMERVVAPFRVSVELEDGRSGARHGELPGEVLVIGAQELAIDGRAVVERRLSQEQRGLAHELGPGGRLLLELLDALALHDVEQLALAHIGLAREHTKGEALHAQASRRESTGRLRDGAKPETKAPCVTDAAAGASDAAGNADDHRGAVGSVDERGQREDNAVVRP